MDLVISSAPKMKESNLTTFFFGVPTLNFKKTSGSHKQRSIVISGKSVCSLRIVSNSQAIYLTNLQPLVYVVPESNAIPRQTPNALIHRTLSKDAAAMTRVGIPFFTP